MADASKSVNSRLDSGLVGCMLEGSDRSTDATRAPGRCSTDAIQAQHKCLQGADATRAPGLCSTDAVKAQQGCDEGTAQMR